MGCILSRNPALQGPQGGTGGLALLRISLGGTDPGTIAKIAAQEMRETG